MIGGVPILDYTPQTLVGVGVIMVFTGLLVPRYIVKIYLDRIKALETMNSSLLAQNNELLETTRLGRATWLALEQGARD